MKTQATKFFAYLLVIAGLVSGLTSKAFATDLKVSQEDAVLAMANFEYESANSDLIFSTDPVTQGALAFFKSILKKGYVAQIAGGRSTDYGTGTKLQINSTFVAPKIPNIVVDFQFNWQSANHGKRLVTVNKLSTTASSSRGPQN